LDGEDAIIPMHDAKPTMALITKLSSKRTLQTILDTGSGHHIFDEVENPTFKRMRLTGIAGETISNVKGAVGNLKDVIQLRNTPANLISVGKLFEDEKWLKFILEKNRDDPKEQYWWGITIDGNRMLIGVRNHESNLLYNANMEAINSDSRRDQSARAFVAEARNSITPRFRLKRSRHDIKETNVYEQHYVALGVPNPRDLKIIDDNFETPIFDVEGRKAIETMSRESYNMGRQSKHKYSAKRRRGKASQKITSMVATTSNSIMCIGCSRNQAATTCVFGRCAICCPGNDECPRHYNPQHIKKQGKGERIFALSLTRAQRLERRNTNKAKDVEVQQELEALNKRTMQPQYLDYLSIDGMALEERKKDGTRETMIIIDHHTKKIFEFHCRTREDTVKRLREWIVNTVDSESRRLNQQHRIRRIKMDGLSVQRGTKIKDMLSKLGIARATIPPGSHRSNGLVENAIKKVKASAKSIWHELGHGMPKHFYFAAVTQAIAALNILPCRGNPGNISAFEMINGRKPRIADIPITTFASVTAKSLDVPKQGKPGTFNGVYLHEEGLNAALIWNPRTGRTVVRSNIVVNEKRSSYPPDRIQRMMRGQLVHPISSTTYEKVRRPVNAGNTRKITTSKHKEEYKGEWHDYELRTCNGVPLDKGAYHCPTCDKSIDTMQGLRTHFTKMHNHENQQNMAALMKIDNREQHGTEYNDIPALVYSESESESESDEDEDSDPEEEDSVANKIGKWFRRTFPNADGEKSVPNVDVNKCYIPNADGEKSVPNVDDNNCCIPNADGEKSVPNANDNKCYIPNADGEKSVPDVDDKNEDIPDADGEKSVPDVDDKNEDIPDADDKKEICLQTEAETRDECIEAAYKKLARNQELDLDRQWDPNENDTEWSTLRHEFQIEDDDKTVFANIGMDFRGAEECKESIDGTFCFGEFELPRDSEMNIIRSPEAMQRLTPRNMRDVAQSPFRDELLEALQTEIDTLNRHNVFSKMQTWRPMGRKPIRLKTIFKAKWKTGVDGEPEFVKWKARIVARGFSAIEGVDYDPTRVSSPVGRASSYMLALAEVASKGMLAFYFDIQAAYLLTKTNEDIWIEMPKGLEIHEGEAGKYCKLNRYLYGLKTSGFEWHETFSKFLLKLKFTKSRNDPCMFTKLTRDGGLMRIILYVDDALCTTNSEEMWHDIREQVDARFKMSEHGPLTNILGMNVIHDRETKTIRINQRLKIEALIERFGMQEERAKPLTPLAPGRTADRADMPTNPEEEEKEAGLATSPLRPNGFLKYQELIDEYRSLLGSLSHIATWGRNDIKHAVYLLARHQAKPSARDYKSALRILNYLKGTINLEMVLGALPFDESSPVEAMVDSNFDTPSTTGFVITVWGSVIHAESRKQGAISRSTMEAELIAASQCTAMVKYIRRVLIEDFRCNLPATPMAEDNTGCIGVAKGGGNHKRRRHIRVADAWIYQEAALAKTIELYQIKSKDNVADMFTKSLESPAFIKFRDIIMGMRNPKNDPDESSE
jgi:hypothetical protein